MEGRNCQDLTIGGLEEYGKIFKVDLKRKEVDVESRLLDPVEETR